MIKGRALGALQGDTTHLTALWHCGGEGLKRGHFHCLAYGGLPSTCLVSSHFTHFLYVPGTLLASAVVMIPRVGGFAFILGLWFKQTLLRNRQFIPLPQPPLVFIASNCEALSSQHWKHGLRSLASGRDHSLPRYPSQFLSTTRECGTTHSSPAASQRCAAISACPGSPGPPLPPICVNVASLNPCFCTSK